MRRYMLAYDADCGPCTRFKRVVEFLDVYHRFDYVPLLQADRGGFLSVVPVALRHRSFHIVSPTGGYLSGAKAIPRLVGLLPFGSLVSKLLTLAPGGLRATGFVYAVFSRLHDRDSCQYKPDHNHASANRVKLLERQFGFYR